MGASFAMDRLSVSVDYTAGGNAMPAAGDRHQSGWQWRSARQKGVLRGIPHERGDWRAAGLADSSPREGWRVAPAPPRRQHLGLRPANPGKLTGRPGTPPI